MDYIEFLYQLASHSKNFIKCYNIKFSGCSGFLEAVHWPNELKELKNLLILGKNEMKNSLILACNSIKS